MQTQKNYKYKNAGMQILVPDNSVEPFNTTFSKALANAELGSSCNLEGCSTEPLDKAAISRVPVISKNQKIMFEVEYECSNVTTVDIAIPRGQIPLPDESGGILCPLDPTI